MEDLLEVEPAEKSSLYLRSHRKRPKSSLKKKFVEQFLDNIVAGAA